jgi:hypothetical protein
MICRPTLWRGGGVAETAFNNFLQNLFTYQEFVNSVLKVNKTPCDLHQQILEFQKPALEVHSWSA